MTDSEWDRLAPGDRVWWYGSQPGPSGVVLAIDARSVLIAWDHGLREEIEVWRSWMIEPARRETEPAW